MAAKINLQDHSTSTGSAVAARKCNGKLLKKYLEVRFVIFMAGMYDDVKIITYFLLL